MINPQALMLKIRGLIFVICVADGHLVQNYLNGEILKKLEDYVDQQVNNNVNFPKESYVFGEVIALLMCIPKRPIFIIGNNQIMNMSFSTMVSNPHEYYKLDESKLDDIRKKS